MPIRDAQVTDHDQVRVLLDKEQVKDVPRIDPDGELFDLMKSDDGSIYGMSDYDEWQGDDRTTAPALPDQDEDRTRRSPADSDAGGGPAIVGVRLRRVVVVAVPVGDGEQTEADDSAERRPEDLLVAADPARGHGPQGCAGGPPWPRRAADGLVGRERISRGSHDVVVGVVEPGGMPVADRRDAVDRPQPRRVVLVELDAAAAQLAHRVRDVRHDDARDGLAGASAARRPTTASIVCIATS